jgi:hypothetical protein
VITRNGVIVRVEGLIKEKADIGTRRPQLIAGWPRFSMIIRRALT